MARKVSLDELEEKDVDSLLGLISEELSTEELDELERQWRQLEEEVEAEQHPMVPLMKQLIMKILQCFTGIMIQGLGYLEEVDPDYERAELTRRRIMATLIWPTMSRCSTRRGGKLCRQLLIPSSGKPYSLRFLPVISLLPEKSPARTVNLLRHCSSP